MIGVLFLCWISTRNAFSQNVVWTVGTSVPKFNEDLRLDCTVVSNCCTSQNRIWETGTGTIILNNGTSSSPNKYVEYWNGTTSGFTLIIKNLQVSDVGVDYNCRYSLDNDNHALTPTASWEYVPIEQCPASLKYFAFSETSDFKFEVARSAPSPSLLAEIGGQKRTSGLTVAGLANFDTWFYSLNASIYVKSLCRGEGKADKAFKLSVTTGTTTKAVCSEIFLCFPCWRCALIWFAFAMGGLLVGCPPLFIIYWIGFSCCSSYWYTEQYFCMKYVKTDDKIGENCSKLYGKSYRNERRNKALIIAAVATIIGYIIVYCVICAVFLIGINCPSCKGNTEIAALAFAGGVLVFLFNFQVALKIFNGNKDQKCLNQRLRFFGIVALSTFIIPIPIMICIHYYCLKGGNNRSKESGSSCWPPCSVGPDPSSPDPENARSLLKKKADKKNEKKPVAVVRSQPPKNRHVKTDNTESTRYSAETEIFDEGVHKSAKPRPLPSIGQPTNSPRPLPQMPPSSQLEKGGIQLEPLGDSTAEKKKKKRKKKKESKQSDEEN